MVPGVAVASMVNGRNHCAQVKGYNLLRSLGRGAHKNHKVPGVLPAEGSPDGGPLNRQLRGSSGSPSPGDRAEPLRPLVGVGVDVEPLLALKGPHQEVLHA